MAQRNQIHMTKRSGKVAGTAIAAALLAANIGGGYLLLHDFNSPKLPGVRRALERFRGEWSGPVPAVPICDINGTLVLPKL